MLYRIEKYNPVTPETNDISDYVTDIGDVPYITRNRDYSLIAEGYDFTLSENCPITLATGDRILFWRESILVHLGEVDIIEYDEGDNTNKITVIHPFEKLQDMDTGDYNDGEDTFEFDLLALDSLVEADAGDKYLIQYRNLIKAIIDRTTVQAVDVDWSNVNYYISPIMNWEGYDPETASQGLLLGGLHESNIWFLPEQIICAGQNGIYSPFNIAASMRNSRVSLFELLSMLCSIVGIYFVPKDGDGFYAVSYNEALLYDVLSDDEILKHKEEEEYTKEVGIETKYNTLDWQLWWTDAASAPPDWAVSTEYYKEQLVLYDGFTWRAVPLYHVSTIFNYPGNTSEYFYYWVKIITTDLFDYEYYIDNDSECNGVDTKYYIEAQSQAGIKPTMLDWFNNFNPLLVSDSVVGQIAEINLTSGGNDYTTGGMQYMDIVQIGGSGGKILAFVEGVTVISLGGGLIGGSGYSNGEATLSGGGGTNATVDLTVGTVGGGDVRITTPNCGFSKHSSTPIRWKARAQLENFLLRVYKTFGENVFTDSIFYDYESVYVVDINNDIVEIESAEIV